MTQDSTAVEVELCFRVGLLTVSPSKSDLLLPASTTVGGGIGFPLGPVPKKEHGGEFIVQVLLLLHPPVGLPHPFSWGLSLLCSVFGAWCLGAPCFLGGRLLLWWPGS